MLVVGAGLDYSEAGAGAAFRYVVDAIYKTGKLGLYASYLGRDTRHAQINSIDVGNTTDWAIRAVELGGRSPEPLPRDLDVEGVGVRQCEGGRQIDRERLPLIPGGRNRRQRERRLRRNHAGLAAGLTDLSVSRRRSLGAHYCR